MRLGLLAALLLAPAAGALSALEESPRLGATEARLVVRAEGDILVVADAPIAVGAVEPGGAPALLSTTPARVGSVAGMWHGLDGVTEIVLVRARPDEARVIDIHDESGAGLTLDWPAMPRGVSGAPVAALVVVVLALTRVRR